MSTLNAEEVKATEDVRDSEATEDMRDTEDSNDVKATEATQEDTKEDEKSVALKKFLLALESIYPEAKALWTLAEQQTKENFCSIVIHCENRVCGLAKIDGLCPYHKDSKHDFYRRCNFLYNDGQECGSSILNRDLNVLWCLRHLNTPKQNVRLRRYGEYIVIKDTPYAVSDDLLSIIGMVKADYNLKFSLSRERDSKMEEVAKSYGFYIRLEDL